MKRTIAFLVHGFLIILFTVLSQIGGMVYLISLVIRSRTKLSRLKFLGIFFGLYLISSMIVVPLLSPFFGRVPLPLYGNLKPLTLVTCLLNRHYVTSELKDLLVEKANQMNSTYPGTKVNYLDANFPFFHGFPLLPHLSHNDGKKVDLAFCYNDATSGVRLNSSPSMIGYGVFDAPLPHETDYPARCREQGFWQYAMISYIVPKWQQDNYVVDPERTSRLVRLFANDSLISKIFLEPHLKERWNLSGMDKIRFQGCHSVRHDDHIHLQIY